MEIIYQNRRGIPPLAYCCHLVLVVGCSDLFPHLGAQCIIFLIVALNREDGFSWTTCANTHFDHLAVEEVGQVLLVDVGCDAANVQAPGLPGQIRVAAYAHSECLDRNWRRETWNTKNRQNLSTVSTREIEETCRLIVR